ncbi:MAG: helix-turn-helix domain-containing protein [Thermoplasmata archaeon]
MPKRGRSRTRNTAHETAYSTGAVAEIFGVTNKTVLSWIKQGKVSAFRTPGGHYRISESEIGRFKDKER